MEENIRKKFLKAYEVNKCDILATCQDVNISVIDFHKFYNSDNLFKENLDIIKWYFVESRLFKNIDSGKETSIINYLEINGAKFGYAKVKDNDNISEIEVNIKYV